MTINESVKREAIAALRAIGSDEMLRLVADQFAAFHRHAERLQKMELEVITLLGALDCSDGLSGDVQRARDRVFDLVYPCLKGRGRDRG